MSNNGAPVIGLKQVKDLTFPPGLHGHSLLPSDTADVEAVATILKAAAKCKNYFY